MALTDYYNQLPKSSHPKTEFIRELAKDCQVSIEAVRAWVKGTRIPNKEHWPAIEKRTNTPAAELFPNASITKQ